MSAQFTLSRREILGLLCSSAGYKEPFTSRGAGGADRNTAHTGVLQNTVIEVDTIESRYYHGEQFFSTLDELFAALFPATAFTPSTVTDEFDKKTLGLRVEERVRNEAYSTSGEGALAGLLGARGALPTGWHFTNYDFTSNGTLSLTITPLPAGRLRLRFHGTPVSTGEIALQCNPTTSAVAASGDVWTNSFLLQQIGTVTGIEEVHCGIIERSATGGFVNSRHRVIFPQSDVLFPHEYTHTLTQGSRVCGKFEVTFAGGVAIDATYEVFSWMLSKNSFRATFVPSVRGATRSADLIAMPHTAASGTVVIDAQVPRKCPSATLWQFDDGTLDNRLTLGMTGGVLCLTAVSGGIRVAELKLGRVIPASHVQVAFAFTGSTVLGSINGKPGVISNAIFLPALGRSLVGSGTLGFWNAAISRFLVLTRAADIGEIRSLSRASYIYDDFARADGYVGSAPAGQSWTGMSPSGNRVQMVISGGKAITPPSGLRNSVAYTGTDFAAMPRAFYVSAAFESGASGSGAVLIANPKGLGAVTDITDGSLHIIFGLGATSVGYFLNGKLTTVRTIFYARLPADGTIRHMGWRVVGQALILMLPDGSLERCASAALIEAGGRYVTWECIYNSANGGPNFYSVQIER